MSKRNCITIFLVVLSLLFAVPSWAEDKDDRYAFIKPHKPTYALGTYSFTSNDDPLKGLDGDLDPVEIKFQLSFKVELFDEWIKKHINQKMDLYFGYTQLSLWQAFNNNLSSPFRETDYEPEFMISFNELNKPFFSLIFSEVIIGFVHQSNGRDEPTSRSWNRICVDLVIKDESENVMMRFRPWYRIPESEENDNNPDILKYMGYAEFSAHYKHHDHQFSLMLRNNLRRPNRSATQFEYSLSLSPWIKLEGINIYFQIFNGYGESLIDYDQSITRIGFGVNITNWL